MDGASFEERGEGLGERALLFFATSQATKRFRPPAGGRVTFSCVAKRK